MSRGWIGRQDDVFLVQYSDGYFLLGLFNFVGKVYRMRPCLVVLGLVGVSLFYGCAMIPSVTTPRVTSNVLTSGANLSSGKRIPAQTFSSQDFVVFLVDFQWDPVGQSGGSHDVEWRWYQNDKLLSNLRRPVMFTSTPYTLRTQRAAATLGIGHFRVETVVDGNIAASSEFDIAQ